MAKPNSTGQTAELNPSGMQVASFLLVRCLLSRRSTLALGLMTVGVCLSACGETSGNGDVDGNSDGTSATTAGPDSGVTSGSSSGTTGTGGAGTTLTNAVATLSTNSTTTNGASAHCHTLEEVQQELDSVGRGPLGNAGQAGAPTLEACPQYYPSFYGPPCGGELVSQSARPVCCYSFVNCN